MTKVHKIAGLKISRVAPQAAADPFEEPPTSQRDLLPDLEPAEEQMRHLKRQLLASQTITVTHSSALDDVFDPTKRPERSSFVARASVYVVNLIVVVMALPVGMALLFFNILFGENFRTTAHILALTGMALALQQTPQGAELLSFL